jgi:hypothetical protein
MGEQIGCRLSLVAATTAEEMRDRLGFLSNRGELRRDFE